MPPKPKVDTIDAQAFAAQYNFAYGLFQSVPELMTKVVKPAIAGGWDEARIIAALRTTKWFRTSSDSARSWAILASADPATAKSRIAARTSTIADSAAQLGVKLDRSTLAKLTKNSLMLGWTDNEMRDHIAAYWHYDAKTPTAGLAATSMDAMRKAAADYLVPVSDKTLAQWTQRVLSGDATADDFTEYAKGQAKSMFPSMAAEIDKGITVAQYADPYKQLASQTLGINAEDVNFMDPKWRTALDQVDPKTGQRSVMTLADWGTKIRTDSQYGYDQTSGARQSSAQLIQALGQKMGF